MSRRVGIRPRAERVEVAALGGLSQGDHARFLVDGGCAAVWGGGLGSVANAMFPFATLECELIDRRRFQSQAEARMAVFDFIEGFYNPRRRHSALDYESPVEYERKYALTA